MNFDDSNNQMFTFQYGDFADETGPSGTVASVDMQNAEWAEFYVTTPPDGPQWNDDMVVTLQDSADDVTFAAVSGVSTVAVGGGEFRLMFLVKRGATRRYVTVNPVVDSAVNARPLLACRQWSDVRSSDRDSPDVIVT